MNSVEVHQVDNLNYGNTQVLWFTLLRNNSVTKCAVIATVTMLVCMNLNRWLIIALSMVIISGYSVL